MKGFVNEFGIAIAPCGTCKYKNRIIDEKPCRRCVSRADLKLCKPANEKEYSNYESRCNK